MSLPDTERCPDCGARLNIIEERDIGREIRKEEVALSYIESGRSEEYNKLPQVLGRQIGRSVTTVTCSACPYTTIDGQVTRRAAS